MKSANLFSKLLTITVIMLPTLMLSMTGCQPAKKPLPPNPAPRIVAEKPYPTRNPAITAEENNGLNNRLSNTAKNIRDVKKASVLVIGTSAYVGFEVNNRVDKARLEAIRPEMAAAIKRTEPRITTVFTGTNPKTVARIDKVRADIRAKKPASAYASNVRSILNESDLVR